MEDKKTTRIDIVYGYSTITTAYSGEMELVQLHGSLYGRVMDWLELIGITTCAVLFVRFVFNNIG